MPIAFDSGRRGGGGRLGRGHAPASGSPSASSGRGSDSRAGVMQYGDGDDAAADGEVQSSFTGPLDTMDALQGALPSNRRGVSKFFNGKSNTVADVVSSPQPAKDPVHPANPSPKKRKGFLPFSFSWNKSRSKESSSRGNATSGPKSSTKTLSPGSSRRNSEHDFCPPRRSLQIGHYGMGTGASASPPTAALRSQIISVQMKSVSVPDVAESTASASPREKRRKSLE